MCEYCDDQNTEVDFQGDDGIVYDKKRNKHYLFVEHYKGECVRVDADYCIKCGRKF